MLRWIRRIAAPMVAVTFLGMTPTIRANTIQAQFLSVTPTGGGTYTYLYQLDLTAGNGLANAATSPANLESGLIVLDFLGLQSATLTTPGLTAAADWNVSTPSNGGGLLDGTLNAGGQTDIVGSSSIAGAADSAAVKNIVLIYKGAGLAVDLSNLRDLIDLSVVSTVGTHAAGAVTTLSRDDGPTTGSRPVETYVINAPVSVVPLPATANMGLAAFAGMGGFGLWRKWKVSKEVLA